MKFLAFLPAFVFLCLFPTACSRVLPVGAPAQASMHSNQKVFVMIDAKDAHEEETLTLMPKLTRALRERGYTVSSGVINKSTDQAMMERTAKRQAEFAPDFVLTLSYLSTLSHDVVNPTNQKTRTYSKEYLGTLTNAKGEKVWQVNLHGNKKLIGTYSSKLANGVIERMEVDGVFGRK